MISVSLTNLVEKFRQIPLLTVARLRALSLNLIAIAGSHPDEFSLAFNIVSTCRVN